jgi:hypothetical protein
VSLDDALRRAQALRDVRASVLREVAAGTSLQAILDRAAGDPDVAEIMALVILEVLPGSGKVSSRRTMAALGLPEMVRLRELDAVQRTSLVEALA